MVWSSIEVGERHEDSLESLAQLYETANQAVDPFENNCEQGAQDLGRMPKVHNPYERP